MVVPNLIIAIFAKDLDVILELIGMFGYLIVPIGIPLMHLVIKHIVPQKSGYELIIDSMILDYGIIILNSFNFLIGIYSIINEF